MTEQDLLDLKEEIAEAKTELATLEGSKETLLQQAKETYACSSVKELGTLLAKMQKEKDGLDKQFTEGLAALEEEMEKE